MAGSDRLHKVKAHEIFRTPALLRSVGTEDIEEAESFYGPSDVIDLPYGVREEAIQSVLSEYHYVHSQMLKRSEALSLLDEIFCRIDHNDIDDDAFTDVLLEVVELG